MFSLPTAAYAILQNMILFCRMDKRHRGAKTTHFLEKLFTAYFQVATASENESANLLGRQLNEKKLTLQGVNDSNVLG